MSRRSERWTLRVQGRCIDTLNGATTAGTRVVLVACSTTSVSQKWSFYTTGFVQKRPNKRSM